MSDEFEGHDWKDYDIRARDDEEPVHLYVDVYLICTYEVYPGRMDTKEHWYTFFLGYVKAKDAKNPSFRGKQMRRVFGEKGFQKYGCDVVEATYFIHKHLK